MASKPGERCYSTDISFKRELRAELRIIGPIERKDIERLKRQIERVLDGINDAFNTGDFHD